MPTPRGYSNVALPSSQDSGDVSVTIPDDTNAYVVAGTYYDGANAAISSFTGSSLTPNTLRATPSPDRMGGYLAWGKVTATGLQTVRLQKASGGYGEGPTCQIVWLDVSDPDNFARDDLLSAGGTGPITGEVDSSATDLVIAIIGGDGGFSPGSMTGFTAQGTQQTNGGDNSRVYTADSPGASTTSCTGPANSYATQALISVYDAVVGGPTITGNPSNATVLDGATASFSASATGTGTVNAQWQYDNAGTPTNISGATSATYNRVGALADTGLQVRCAFTDDNGTSYTEWATLTVVAQTFVFGTGPKLATMLGHGVCGAGAFGEYLQAVSSGTTSHSLAALATAQAAATAALGLSKPLAGAATAQAAATAALLKGVSLAAAGVATASASATMAHQVPLAASAAAVASAGAQLALAVTLSAAAIAQAAASAGVSVGKSLAAGAAAEASGSAGLQVTSGADLAADAQAQAGGSAVLSLVVNLSAAAVAQAHASAALAMGKPLAASAAAQAAATAGLQVTGSNELAASAQAQAGGSASLALDVPLSAAAIAQAQAAGSLTVVLVLNASALAQASGTAQLVQGVQLSAEGVALATASAALTVVGEFARAPSGSGYRRPMPAFLRPARLTSAPRRAFSNTTRPRR